MRGATDNKLFAVGYLTIPLSLYRLKFDLTFSESKIIQKKKRNSL